MLDEPSIHHQHGHRGCRRTGCALGADHHAAAFLPLRVCQHCRRLTSLRFGCRVGRPGGAVLPADGCAPVGALQQQRIDCHHERTARHRQCRDLRAQHERVQDARGERETRSRCSPPPTKGSGASSAPLRAIARSRRRCRTGRSSSARHQRSPSQRRCRRRWQSRHRLGQCRRIVDTIAHHPDFLPRGLAVLYLLGLLPRQHVGQHAVDAEVRGDALAVAALSPVSITTSMLRSRSFATAPWRLV